MTSRRACACALLMLSVQGCTGPTSRLVVRVHSDLEVSRELASLHIEVRRAGEEQLETADIPIDSAAGLPVDFVVLTHRSPPPRVELALELRAGSGAAIVRRRVLVDFVPGKTALLEIFLLRACEAPPEACDEPEDPLTCDDGTCVGALVTTPLPTIEMPLALTRDGALDGGLDGAADSGVIDAGTPCEATERVATIISSGVSVHTCALTSCGRALCWGRNDEQQIGMPTSTPIRAPALVELESGLPIASIDTGGNHTCAIGSGPTGVLCWGRNRFGQLGNGTTLDTFRPTRSSANGSGFLALATGSAHTCVRLGPDRGVSCWGTDSQGQLGDGGATSEEHEPVQVSGITYATRITAGQYHTCARVATGAIQCWGANEHGQLGDGDGGAGIHRSTPVAVRDRAGAAITNWIGPLAAGMSFTCAIRNEPSRSVYCWGLNDEGQLGVTTPTGSDVPIQVPGVSGAIQIAAGGVHACAITGEGSVVCWGRNRSGQIGLGRIASREPPTVIEGLSGVIEITAGGNHTCAVRASGPPLCWGRNAEGELGIGTAETLRVSPTPIAWP